MFKPDNDNLFVLNDDVGDVGGDDVDDNVSGKICVRLAQQET